MPNGGSDCCGTCWFNARNKGEAGYEHADDPEPNHCTIRDLAIENAFYTYCSNHPHRRPKRDPVPIGPVFVSDGSVRRVWKPSPDTEEVRDHLLKLLSKVRKQPAEEYPMGNYCDEVVVWQLGEFKEGRAAAELKRIAAFKPEPSLDRFGRTHAKLIALAQQALGEMGAQ